MMRELMIQGWGLLAALALAVIALWVIGSRMPPGMARGMVAGSAIWLSVGMVIVGMTLIMMYTTEVF